MKIEELIGYYTFRSFRDRPDPVNDFNTIKFAETELFLHVGDDGVVSGLAAFPADTTPHRKGVMDLAGKVSSWEPLRLHFVGKGQPHTEMADSEYEHDCTVAPTWDFSVPPQRTVLSGTVRCNKNHGTATAGATASFVAVKRDFAEPRTIPA